VILVTLGGNEILAVLDANVFLEFRDFPEIDWQELFQARKVVLLVTLPVLKDLDKAKISSGRRRDRAVSVLRRLSNLTSEFGPADVRVRDGVTLRVQRVAIDRDSLPAELNSDDNDDLVVAIALELEQEYPGLVLLVTDDSVVKAKGKLLGARIFSMPEEFRRPAEPTPESREVARLRTEMDQLKSKVPQPSLHFRVNGELITQATVRLQAPRAPEARDFDNRIARMRSRFDEIVSGLRREPPQSGGFASVLQRPVPEEEMRNFEREVNRYLETYREYLEKLHKWEKVIGRQTPIEFLVWNGGFTPAEETYVFLHFPDGVEVEEEPSPEPDAPVAPVPPSKSIFSWLDLQVPRLVPPEIPDLSDILLRKPGAPRIRKERSVEVEFGPEKVMHGTGFAWKLGPIWVTLPEGKGRFDLSIRYDIHAANLPVAVSGELQLIAEYTTVEPWSIKHDREDGNGESMD
jgi:hypothetical protein